MTAGQQTRGERIVGVRRRIRATRTSLYQAWTDPSRFIQWFGPKTWTVERCEIDARAGGSWRAWLKRGDGASICVGGVYTIVEPERRIVFTWDNDERGRLTDITSLVTVEFVELGDGVEVSITHRALSSGQRVDMDVGWNSTLDSLEAYIGQSLDPISRSEEEER
jgi:uncharacterized protein YndB with AHSA1/START domain